jgi:hypothetical protein
MGSAGKRFPPAIGNVRPSYHNLGAQTMSIEKQDSQKKNDLTKLSQH